MNKEAFKRNAVRGIEIQEASKDPSAGVILACKRNIELVDVIWEQISDEDKARMKNASTDMLECKDIKERYKLSWNELKEMRSWEDTLLTYKIDVVKALADAGFNSNRIRKERIFPESTLQKLRQGSTNISLDTLARICRILDKQPSDIIEMI